MTLRTDCKEIVVFYNKNPESKLSGNQRLEFMDYIIGNGLQVTIKHIKGNNNCLADKFSRKIKEPTWFVHTRWQKWGLQN